MLSQRMQEFFATALWFIAAIVIFGYMVLVLTGCGSTAIAQTTAGGLSGTYIFRSQGFTASGAAFFEVGTHTYNADGSQCTNSVMNVAGTIQRINGCGGTFSWDKPSGIGQGHSDLGDASFFAVTRDQARIFVVCNNDAGTWSAELVKQ